jgi:hypothetical protein
LARRTPVNRTALGWEAPVKGVVVSAAVVICALLSGTAAASASTGWQAEPMPKPPGAGSTVAGSVSCPAKGSCTAVGDFLHNGRLTLAEHWNGTSWASQSTPNLFRGELAGVSCASPAKCIAVGAKQVGGGRPLAERWDGTSWTLQGFRLPAGAAAAGLSAVSCVSTADCIAVGEYVPASSHVNQPWAAHWNGTSWTAELLPLPTQVAPGGAHLNSVSCPTAHGCIAVGSYSTFGQEDHLLAERWNGHQWSLQAVPRPAGSAVIFNSVSCPSVGSCTAVGASYNSSSQQMASIVERWNGTSWAQEADAAPAHTALSGVSCPSATECTAVGTVWAGLGSKAALVAEHWNGTNWAVQATPAPLQAKQEGLYGVSCLVSLSCTAVGDYNPGNGDAVPYAEQEH